MSAKWAKHVKIRLPINHIMFWLKVIFQVAYGN